MKVARSFEADAKTGQVLINSEPFPFYIAEDIDTQTEGPITTVRFGLLVEGEVKIKTRP